MTVAIVIPIYKTLISTEEKLSFVQCTKVLASYPIILVAPMSLNVSAYEELSSKHIAIKRFDDAFFKDIAGYNKLLTSKRFYQAFNLYDYILLYQLDAWVFKDDLRYWIEQEYDYIGAPWLDAPPILSGKKPLVNLSKRLVNQVGNGGFSLRKIASHLKWSWWVSLLFKFFPKNEDALWTLFVPFKKPSPKKALLFAFERNPKKSFELTQQRLPFGCHAWQKYEPHFWNKYINDH